MDDDVVASDDARVLLLLGLNVHLLARQVVLGLTNIHPVAGQLHLVEVTLACHFWENLSLDRARLLGNSWNHVGVEKVKASVDLVAHESSWLFDEAVDLTIFLGNNDAVLAGVLDSSHDDGALLAVVLVEFNEFVQWVLANNIGVEHEDLAVLPASAEEVRRDSQGSSSSHGDILNDIMNFGVANLKFD